VNRTHSSNSSHLYRGSGSTHPPSTYPNPFYNDTQPRRNAEYDEPHPNAAHMQPYYTGRPSQPSRPKNLHSFNFPAPPSPTLKPPSPLADNTYTPFPPLPPPRRPGNGILPPRTPSRSTRSIYLASPFEPAKEAPLNEEKLPFSSTKHNPTPDSSPTRSTRITKSWRDEVFANPAELDDDAASTTTTRSNGLLRPHYPSYTSRLPLNTSPFEPRKKAAHNPPLPEQKLPFSSTLHNPTPVSSPTRSNFTRPIKPWGAEDFAAASNHGELDDDDATLTKGEGQREAYLVQYRRIQDILSKQRAEREAKLAAENEEIARKALDDHRKAQVDLEKEREAKLARENEEMARRDREVAWRAQERQREAWRALEREMEPKWAEKAKEMENEKAARKALTRQIAQREMWKAIERELDAQPIATPEPKPTATPKTSRRCPLPPGVTRMREANLKAAEEAKAKVKAIEVEKDGMEDVDLGPDVEEDGWEKVGNGDVAGDGMEEWDVVEGVEFACEVGGREKEAVVTPWYD
jgi:hypothetical protein